ncbi:hypothetical protein E6Q11_05525 [Candidatus Dojkabacteria bacterium]|uniref:Uncharacterized protein n=1 Tax=Candidatus Dojkabacteria bacterium TaxID=2099670 RepID=A0A5C7J538_9BACT|nr:MAG: hypothetical protein E6Q11_05525 [Candidatus Dojkabacteria bacterium]
MKKIIFAALFGMQIYASYGSELNEPNPYSETNKGTFQSEIGSFDKKAKKFSQRMSILIENNKLPFGYLLGLGGCIAAKKTAKNLFSKIVLPVVYWNIIHTAFISSLYIFNKENPRKFEDFKRLLNPLRPTSLTERESILCREIFCYPVLHTIKTLFDSNEEVIQDKKTQILNIIKQDLPYALTIGLGICTPYLYSKLKKQLLKALLTYILGHELFLISGLVFQGNTDSETYKGFLKDHLNPTAEIEIANTVFKISPLLHFFYDLANTLVPTLSEQFLNAVRSLNEEKNKKAFLEIVNKIKKSEKEEDTGNLFCNLENVFLSSKGNLSEIEEIKHLVKIIEKNPDFKNFLKEKEQSIEEIKTFMSTIESTAQEAKINDQISERISKLNPSLFIEE